eukprot:11834440-Ditylum_brightwellii.AAC.1
MVGNAARQVATYKITASSDTGWQRRSIGHNFNSISGHGFLVGAWTTRGNIWRLQIMIAGSTLRE